MDKTLKLRVSAMRRMLRNPYAYLEHLESCSDDFSATSSAGPRANGLEASRKVLQDPYAYLDDSGGYSAAPDECETMPDRAESARGVLEPLVPASESRDASLRLYTDREIETIVRDLQARLWRDRKRLWDGSAPSDPVDILDPAIAVHLVGYEFLLADGLGQFQSGSGVIEVAGLIDRTSRTVHVSRQFPLPVQTFTAAHELGHAVLRPIGGGVHRDRAIDGPNQSRDRFELEADKFATYFLLPANLVRKRFEALFGTAMFFLSEETAFALCGLAIQDVRRKYSTRRHLSRLLAGAEQYNGRHFVSLAVQFRVSIEAMAIRLEELELLSR